jgi:signal peptidase II
MQRKYKILIAITPAVLILDQVTKWLILSYVTLGDRLPVISDIFDIVHFRNTGAAFGMFSGLSDAVRAPFFYVVAALAAVVLGFMYRALSDREVLMPVALSLVFGGIAGNVVDRVRFGEVVDFLSVHIGDRIFMMDAFGRRFTIPLEWPAFNVADMAITMAMMLIVISAFMRARERN